MRVNFDNDRGKKSGIKSGDTFIVTRINRGRAHIGLGDHRQAPDGLFHFEEWIIRQAPKATRRAGGRTRNTGDSRP